MFSSGETLSKVAKTEEAVVDTTSAYQATATGAYDPSAYTSSSAYTSNSAYTASYSAAAAATAAAAYGYTNPAQSQWAGYTAAQPVSYM